MASTAEITALIRKNTTTNYILVAVKLVEGVLVTRWMFRYLGKEYYGFWALLWSLFIYVLVFDFGFSKAAQKCTAERLFEEDVAAYNRITSAVFSLQWVISLVIVAISAVAAVFLPELTRESDPAYLHYGRAVLMVFGLGIALTFPTGMFPEILVGMKLIYIKNYVLILGRMLELFGILAVFKFGGSLMSLVIFTITLNVSLNMLMFIQLKKRIPGFRLKLISDWPTLRSLMDFSLFSYLASIANLIIRKTDRVVLSTICGLESVGIYQLGTRLPELAESMTMQYQDNVTPYTAELCKQKKIATLREIVLKGLKLTSFLSAGFVALGVLLSRDLMVFLFDSGDPQVVLVCQWMLVNVFFAVAIRGFASRMMLMSGFHRAYCAWCWVEALSNLGLSIWLLYRIGLLGVIYGTLIPNLVLSLGVMLPFIARLIEYSYWKLLVKYFVAPVAYAAAAAAVAWYLERFTGGWGLFWKLALQGGAGGMVYLALSLLFYFKRSELPWPGRRETA